MSPRILFVVSGAYGDLAQVMHFSEGQAFRSRSAVALARQLYEVNHDSLPLRTYSYGSVGEILAAAADWDARIVIMLSAYGFPIEGLTTTKGLRALVQRLRDRGCHVVTTDPFLGFGSAIRTMDMWRTVFVPSATSWKHRLMLWRVRFIFWREVRKRTKAITGSARCLRDVTHLYPMPAQALPNGGRQRRISYVNLNATRSEERQAQGVQSWLFAISPTDHDLQQRRWGAAGFVNQLVSLFVQARAAGRQPVLIAPPALIKNLGRVLPASIDAELNQFGAYAEFETRLLAAEYAFYWNLFSASALQMRLLRRLPTFFFDRGHVAHFHQGMYDAAVRSYYGGWEPKLLPHGVMEPGALARFWEDQQAALDSWMEYMRQSPAPAQVLDALMRGSLDSSPG